jgi:hypothetical protein
MTTKIEFKKNPAAAKSPAEAKPLIDWALSLFQSIQQISTQGPQGSQLTSYIHTANYGKPGHSMTFYSKRLGTWGISWFQAAEHVLEGEFKCKGKTHEIIVIMLNIPEAAAQ